MGSRIGCHLALEEPVDAIVCLGYPLVSPGPSKKLRDEVLLATTTPILFVQGTRDSLCPLPQLAKVLERMRAPHELFVVESGDHSLQITKTHARTEGTTQEKVDERVRLQIRAFLDRVA
jgi:predicted alpha/beta-hydrolase family hydrolase